MKKLLIISALFVSSPVFAASNEVVVPDITQDCSIDADKLLKKAGLVPKRKPIHGPIDEDAASFGCPYRQNPKAGTVVKKGSKVTYRFWWEAG